MIAENVTMFKDTHSDSNYAIPTRMRNQVQQNITNYNNNFRNRKQNVVPNNNKSKYHPNQRNKNKFVVEDYKKIIKKVEEINKANGVTKEIDMLDVTFLS